MSLIDDLRTEADLCRNETVEELADLLDAAADEIQQLRKREFILIDLLRSARCIAERKGEDVAWERFSASIGKEGIGRVTARTYRILDGDRYSSQSSQCPHESIQSESIPEPPSFTKSVAVEKMQYSECLSKIAQIVDIDKLSDGEES